MDPRTERMLAEHRRAEESAPPASTGQLVRVRIAAWLSGRRIRLAASLVVLAFGVWVTHYGLVTLPAHERDRQAAVQHDIGTQQALAEIARSDDFDACLAAAQADYERARNESCRELHRPDNCSLPKATANRHEQQRRLAREACIRQYSR